MSDNNPEVEPNCKSNCRGLCCHDVSIAINEPELVRLVKAGTILVQVLPIVSGPSCGDLMSPSPDIPFSWSQHTKHFIDQALNAADAELKRELAEVAAHTLEMQPGQGLYIIYGRCGNLQADDTCGDYDNRPETCELYEMGGPSCFEVREVRSDELPVQITKRP